MKEFSRRNSSGVTSPAAKRRMSSARWRPSISRTPIGWLTFWNLLPLALAAKSFQLGPVRARKFFDLLCHLLYLFLPPSAGGEDAAVSIRSQFRTVCPFDDEDETTGIDDAVAFASDNTHRHARDGELPERFLVVVNYLLGMNDLPCNPFFVVVFVF